VEVKGIAEGAQDVVVAHAHKDRKFEQLPITSPKKAPNLVFLRAQ
jgi:hypothetical protein